MKKHLLLTGMIALSLFLTLQLSAQVSISPDNCPADPSAMLDVKSTSKGVVLPRMTFEQRNAIPNPVEGLMVYCTNCELNGSGSLSIFMNGFWNILNAICLNAPLAGSQMPSINQIVWNWNTVSGATGYKWNTTNNYTTAVYISTMTTKTETGLMPNTTYTRFVWAYNSCGISTVTILSYQTSPVYIGQNYEGGIIFYVDGTGQHGLIAATSDQSTGAQWGCYGTTIGGTSTAIGNGQANTYAIVNGCTTAGIAARICYDLVLNGYDDWFLPSKDELNQMYLQKNIIGGFDSRYYLSSSEDNANAAWEQHFGDGSQVNYQKGSAYWVRAVRDF